MKRYGTTKHTHKKWKDRQHNNERAAGGFRCSHCKCFVAINETMGTMNRNHCNQCLWSKHVDESTGDRRSTCGAGMEPIGLTLKHEGYGKMGEIMLIHLCSGCTKISINRVARDDPEHMLLGIFERSFELSKQIKSELSDGDIYLLRNHDRYILSVQLFGA